MASFVCFTCKWEPPSSSPPAPRGSATFRSLWKSPPGNSVLQVTDIQCATAGRVNEPTTATQRAWWQVPLTTGLCPGRAEVALGAALRAPGFLRCHGDFKGVPGATQRPRRSSTCRRGLALSRGRLEWEELWAAGSRESRWWQRQPWP